MKNKLKPIQSGNKIISPKSNEVINQNNNTLSSKNKNMILSNDFAAVK